MNVALCILSWVVIYLKNVITKWFQQGIDSVGAFYREIGINSPTEFEEYVTRKVPEALCYGLRREDGILGVTRVESVYQILTVMGVYKVRLHLLCADFENAYFEFV